MDNGVPVLRLDGRTTVRLADGMYRWCMLIRFAFDDQPAGGELIGAMLAHPRYPDSCMSKWTEPQGDVHGPYRLETLTVDGFQRCSAAAAVEILMGWPTHVRPSASGQMLLAQEIVGAWVSPLLIAADEIYRLIVPREDNEHDSGWVVGFCGFHEFIAIDRLRGELTLVIGSDD